MIDSNAVAIHGSAFDITEYHKLDDTSTYSNLSEALGTAGANIPEDARHGGMTVKFVQSSDNKYVQYRLMKNTWSTTVTDWQGVDENVTQGSNNLVTSDAVYKIENTLHLENINTSNQVEDFRPINEDFFALSDGEGNVGFKVEDGKVDALGFGSNLQRIIDSSISASVASGVATSKDYTDEKIEEILGEQNVNTEENGFFITDQNGNVGAQVDEEGKIDALGLGDNLKEKIEEILGEQNVNTEENGFFITDQNGNVGAQVDEEGKIDALGLGDNLKADIKELVSGFGNSVNYGQSHNILKSDFIALYDETKGVVEKLTSLKDNNGHNFSQTITIPMSQATENIKHGVFRLGLHYGTQIGDVKWHEIFFGGNVNKDFSDVRVKDSNGNILPIRLLHAGNYEVVQDSNIKSSSDKVLAFNGRAYFRMNKLYYTNDEFKTSVEIPNQTITHYSGGLEMDAFGGLWYEDADTLDVYVCYPVNGEYNFANQVLVTNLSVTNGVTNSIDSSGPRLQDFVTDELGYGYFGVYQSNINAVIFRTINPITSAGLTPDINGNYVFECYNQPRVYVPGTEILDNDYCDQHVHHIHIFYAKDSNNNDVCNIIAGLDNSNTKYGPNIISSIDRGQTWVSFRETIDSDEWRKQRGHDYAFTWMSSDNTFTICGGENDVLCGYALHKMYTKVDDNGRIIPTSLVYPLPTLNSNRQVMSDGDNWIFASLCGNYGYAFNTIVVSEDKGKTWNSIYTEYSNDTIGVGSGNRKFSQKILLNNSDLNESCWYGCDYGNTFHKVRLYRGGNHYYGELLVEVGELNAGTDVTLTVESGYLLPAVKSKMFKENIIEPIWELPLNEGCGDTVMDNYGHKYIIEGTYDWDSPDNGLVVYGSCPAMYHNERSGLRLNASSCINLGKVGCLNFNKGFSVVFWMAYGDHKKPNYGRYTVQEHYMKDFPILNSDKFMVSLNRWGVSVGGKNSGTFSRCTACDRIEEVIGVYQPIMITVSNDIVPTITSYVGDYPGKVLDTVTASTWLSENLSELNFKIGTTEASNNEINKNRYIRNISIYNKILTRQEFKSIIRGCSITTDYKTINF